MFVFIPQVAAVAGAEPLEPGTKNCFLISSGGAGAQGVEPSSAVFPGALAGSGMAGGWMDCGKHAPRVSADMPSRTTPLSQGGTPRTKMLQVPGLHLFFSKSFYMEATFHICFKSIR